jgi:hypothetical protein
MKSVDVAIELQKMCKKDLEEMRDHFVNSKLVNENLIIAITLHETVLGMMLCTIDSSGSETVKFKDLIRFKHIVNNLKDLYDMVDNNTSQNTDFLVLEMYMSLVLDIQ